MCLRKIILIIFVLLFLLISEVFADTKDNQKIEISISLDKDTFLIREPIWLEISAVNLSDKDIAILSLIPECIDCIQIVLKNSQSNSLGYEGMIYDYITGYPHGALVKPNEVYKNEYGYNLLDGFGERVNNWPLRRFLKPDVYTVQVAYLNRISSNILEFKVETPKGDEEKAYQLLAEGISHLFKQEREKLVEKLRGLVDKYPKSVYTDLAYYEMAYWDKNKERAKDNARKLILNYSNSKFVKNALWELIRGQKKWNKRGF